MNYVEYKIGKSRLIIIEGDITKQVTYAIVNAADKELSVGGGVSGAAVGSAVTTGVSVAIAVGAAVASGNAGAAQALSNSIASSAARTDNAFRLVRFIKTPSLSI